MSLLGYRPSKATLFVEVLDLRQFGTVEFSSIKRGNVYKSVPPWRRLIVSVLASASFAHAQGLSPAGTTEAPTPNQSLGDPEPPPAAFPPPSSTAEVPGSQPPLAPINAPVAGQPQPALGDACFPPCRSGYLCDGSRCVSRCNPPCANGEVCADDGSCIRRSPDIVGGSERADLEPVEPPVEAKQRERERYRMSPRLTLHGLISLGAMVRAKVGEVGLTGAIGYRQNLLPQFGIHVRLGAGVAAATTSSQDSNGNVTSSDSTTMGECYGELNPFFGPMGRFYLGPILWLSYFTFNRNTLDSNTEHIVLGNAWKGGGGIDMGILALSHEQLDINWRIKSSFNDQVPFRLEMGVGYHFM